MNIIDGMVLESGVILKFKSGRSLIYDDFLYFNFFEARGTVDNPVILDGDTGTPGSWGGLYLGGYFRIDHCSILNGGEFLLPDASEKANVVYAYNGPGNNGNRMHNSTVANSAGYGIVQEFITEDYDFLDPAKNNIFTDNALGDFIKVRE
ncbi:MAG: hypothetical protein HF978_18700 [Desulfobacteraceae bacterium]|nr:hypothetical protein [Desulfobacteraceae bacterium]MBC2757577.1 hypothetical protein [Desulfobacteraceae bacterium]